ncbi:hypothetical protein PHMEG_00011054 [Phytophthora megakarya]|uniref:Ubiquitin-like protease family profile domain-containing protein n=1 Tax=Phytophthora megakarya TaxID=4795 RepID=A0A225WC61_9STRA|nr:hypothetical protein PHMEG_00011054 [Phytophthora megakarya]
MWREKLPKLESFSDLVSWIRLSIFSRLSLSPPLNNCTNVDTKACATRLETINLKRTVKSRFGNIAVHEIAAFRRSQLLDDACIMLVLSNMVDRDRVAYPRVGIGAVNPLFMTMADDEVKRDVIEHSLPFQTENKVVPIPIHLEAHWAGVVFNYNDNKLVYFDPMQSKANYDSMEASTSAKIKCGFVIIRQRAPRQQDTTSCGPLTLLFFDCMVVGILVSNVQPESIPYLRFRFLYLSCQNIFCDGTESNTEIDVV